MAKQLAFHVDISACTGCKACQVACKDKNQLPIGVNWRKVYQYEGGEWSNHNGFYQPGNVFAYFVSTACQHCQDAPCIEVCPAAAISKRSDGIVLIDDNRCIGCRYCEWACPYGAPQFDQERKVMTKCNMCYDLIDKGEKPACVDGCPYRALEIGDLEELQAKYGTFAAPAPLPDPNITHPSVVFTPSKMTKSYQDVSGKIMNLEEL